MNQHIPRGLAAATTLCALALPAADFFTSDELKTLVSGNTVHFEVPDEGEFRAYLNSNGTVIRMHDGQALEGSWSIKGDGALCLHYVDKEERCGRVTKSRDSTYTRIDDAGVTNYWTKVAHGRDL
jgi:hypothetical protein